MVIESSSLSPFTIGAEANSVEAPDWKSGGRGSTPRCSTRLLIVKGSNIYSFKFLVIGFFK